MAPKEQVPRVPAAVPPRPCAASNTPPGRSPSGHRVDGRAAAVVPGDVGGAPLVARPGGPGRHRRVRGLVQAPGANRPAVADEMFDAAPRALARTLSLQQTVELIKVTIDVVEEQVTTWRRPARRRRCARRCSRYSREVAFGAAQVYARAAETRGAWDARLQALLVDALLRGETDDVLAAGPPRWAGRPPPSRWWSGTVTGRRGRRRAAHRRPARARRARRGRARRRARRPAGRGARRGDDPLAATEKLAGGSAPARWWSGRRCRDCGPRPVGARRAGRVPGGRRLAGRPAPGGRGRPAARTGPGRRPRGPPDAAPGGVRARWLGRGAAGDAGRAFLEQGSSLESAARSCSCTRTRCGTGCAGWPR